MCEVYSTLLHLLVENWKERKWKEDLFFFAVNHGEQNRAFLNMSRIRAWGLVMFDRVPKCISLIIIMSVARIFHIGAHICRYSWLFFKYKVLLSRLYIYVRFLLLNWKEFWSFFHQFTALTPCLSYNIVNYMCKFSKTLFFYYIFFVLLYYKVHYIIKLYKNIFKKNNF